MVGELTRDDLGHLTYLHRVLTQPPDAWDGFYTPLADSMNFGLRFQVAFAAYAVAALARRTPAYRRPYAEALAAACERMRDVRVWGYWRTPVATSPAPTDSGHLAVMFAPHSRRVLGPPADPIIQNNVQFSGHFSTVLGLYERLTGDDRYDRPFVLGDAASGVAYEYTHTAVAERIRSQMAHNRFGGVCCEDGVAYVACNNHALSSNALHDVLHGSDFSATNVGWLRHVRRNMVLKGPTTLRGLLAVCYLRDVHLSAPVAFNFTDAWGLAFLLPFDPALVRRLYPRLRRRLTEAGRDGAFLASSPLSEKMEISDVPLNTAFALIAARGVGDARTADRLATYAEGAFGHRWDGAALSYADAPRTLHTTALYALANVADGDTLPGLFHGAPPTAGPVLDQVVSAEPVGVARAAYDPVARVLHLGLERLGAAGPPVLVTLTCTGLAGVATVQAAGSAPEWLFDPATGRLTVRLLVAGRQDLAVQM